MVQTMFAPDGTIDSQENLVSRTYTLWSKEKVKRNPCHEKHRESGHFAKTQGILIAQVVNSPFLKIRCIAIFAAKSSSYEIH